MRTLPEDPPTAGATAERVVVAFGEGLQKMLDLRFRHRLDPTVALHTAGKRIHRLPKVETPHDLHDLARRPNGAHEVAMDHNGTLEKVAILGEENPVLANRDLCQIGVVKSPIADRVEPEKTEVFGQPSEIHVDDEAAHRRLRTKPSFDLERAEDRVDADPVAGLELITEVDRFAGHKD